LDAYAILYYQTESAMPATDDDMLPPFSLPSIRQKAATAWMVA